MSHYVFSTLSTDMNYTHWIHSEDKNVAPAEGRSIFIQGGTGVAQKANRAFDVYTPLGRVTEVSDEDLGLLEQIDVFKLHKKNGFIHIQKKSAEPEKIAASMSRSDPSSPKTEVDFPNATTDVPTSKAR